MSWSNKNKKHISFIKQSKCMNFIILLTFYIKLEKNVKRKEIYIYAAIFFLLGGKNEGKILTAVLKGK